jgi:hypothetical protein
MKFDVVAVILMCIYSTNFNEKNVGSVPLFVNSMETVSVITTYPTDAIKEGEILWQK